jgi:hypothetical protein
LGVQLIKTDLGTSDVELPKLSLQVTVHLKLQESLVKRNQSINCNDIQRIEPKIT